MKAYTINEWESRAGEHITFYSMRLREGLVMQATGTYRDCKVIWDCGGICYHQGSMKRCKKGDIEF